MDEDLEEKNRSFTDLEDTNVDEGTSDYVSALVRYDTLKFESDLERSSSEVFDQSYTNFYSSIFPKNSFSSTSLSSFEVESVRLKSEFELNPSAEFVSEDFLAKIHLEKNCDVCFTSLKNVSKSYCRHCKVVSHTNCLLNNCNSVTELKPVTNGSDSDTNTNLTNSNSESDSSESEIEDESGVASYRYICKLCLLRVNKAKRPRCVICNLQGGILNFTEKIYYHPFCVLYTFEGLHKYFNHSLLLTSVNEFKKHLQHVNNLNKSECNNCIVCGGNIGFLVKCSYESCSNHLHPRCVVNSESYRKSPRNSISTASDKKHLVLYAPVTYQVESNPESCNTVIYKGVYCSSHSAVRYVNNTICKYLVNSVVYKINAKKEPETGEIRGQTVSIPKISSGVQPVGNVKRKLNEIIEDLSNRVKGAEEVKEEVKRLKLYTICSEKRVKGEDSVTNEASVSASVDGSVADGLEELKVQKVLWNKLDIFSNNDDIFFNNNHSLLYNILQQPHQTEGSEGTSVSSLLPLGSLLFDNMSTNSELLQCYQQQFLSSCKGVLAYLEYINGLVVGRVGEAEEGSGILVVLMENYVANCVLIYEYFGLEMDPERGEKLLGERLKCDLGRILSSHDSAFLADSCNIYSLSEDIKCLGSVNGRGFGGSGRVLAERPEPGMRLVKCIRLSVNEVEIMKRAILQLTRQSVELLVTRNSSVSVECSSEGSLRYLNWYKIINSVNALYSEKQEAITPLKYSEYLLQNAHLYPSHNQSVSSGVSERANLNYVNEELRLVNRELEALNRKLGEIRSGLYRAILGSSLERANGSFSFTGKSPKELVRLYNVNEYNYYIICNFSKLTASESKLPTRLLLNSDKSVPAKTVAQPGPVGLASEINYCQICFIYDENNINAIIKCNRCLVHVHKYCYNIYKKRYEYLCNRCEYEKKQNQVTFKKFSILCSICRRGSGVFIRLNDLWFHNFCLITLKYLDQGHIMTRSDEAKCAICEIGNGVFLRCSKCELLFHPYCGYFQGFKISIAKHVMLITCNGCDPDLRVFNVIYDRNMKYLNRDINETIYDKDKKKRVIQTSQGEEEFVEDEFVPEVIEQEDDLCRICFQAIKSSKKRLKCTGCGVQVHKHCYPLPLTANEEFSCTKCKADSAQCSLCLSGEDVLVEINNKLYHVICYIVENISERRGEMVGQGTCNVCLKSQGLMLRCYKSECSDVYHPNCGLKSKLVIDFYYSEFGVEYITLCQEHSLLHNAVGSSFKLLLKFRVQLLMMRDYFHDLYQQNLVSRALLRKRKQIYNTLYPLGLK